MNVTPYAQTDYRLRCDWGLSGAREIAGPDCLLAVVDILSFSTTLTVAADRHIEVFPYRWRDGTAADFAREQDAVLAVGRTQARPGEVSLSPATLRDAGNLRRLVLPSPNGSTIAHSSASVARKVVGVSLRNASATAAWAAAHLRRDESASLAVVAAGERWPDGTSRPAAEDLWGAGALLDAVAAHGVGPASPEAGSAIAAYRHVAADIAGQLHACASGRELAGLGYRHDVDVAAEVDRSQAVPVLTGLSFQPTTDETRARTYPGNMSTDGTPGPTSLSPGLLGDSRPRLW